MCNETKRNEKPTTCYTAAATAYQETKLPMPWISEFPSITGIDICRLKPM